MTNERVVWAGPSVGASGTISNPWFVCNAGERIVSPSKVELEGHRCTLFFEGSQVWGVFPDKSSAPIFNVVLGYVVYRSFVNYNIWGLPSSWDDESLFEDVGSIRFNLRRVVRVDTGKSLKDSTWSSPSLKEQDEYITLPCRDLSRFLSVLDELLWSALVYYLQGCNNERYFLVEFYKAVEAIRGGFANEAKFLAALRPHGVTKKGYKELTRACNTPVGEVAATGRHAPRQGTQPYPVDFRYLWVDQKLYETFEMATTQCRTIIDAYIKFLAAERRSTAPTS